MRTADELRDPDSPWDDVEADRRTVDKQQRLTDDAGRMGPGVGTAPHAVADIEREVERRRIGLQILAVVVPWRDALRKFDAAECDVFRVRGHALLNYLDVAVMPYPDLQDALAAARSELAQEGPMAGWQR